MSFPENSDADDPAIIKRSPVWNTVSNDAVEALPVMGLKNWPPLSSSARAYYPGESSSLSSSQPQAPTVLNAHSAPVTTNASSVQRPNHQRRGGGGGDRATRSGQNRPPPPPPPSALLQTQSYVYLPYPPYSTSPTPSPTPLPPPGLLLRQPPPQLTSPRPSELVFNVYPYFDYGRPPSPIRPNGPINIRNFNYLVSGPRPYFQSHAPEIHHELSQPMRSDLPGFIVYQIDHYFSDKNLEKDYYLRSQMDNQGWVPVSLIAGFPRIKRRTENISLILDSMKSSKNVEVQGDKLRKRHGWEKYIIVSRARQESDATSEAVAA